MDRLNPDRLNANPATPQSHADRLYAYLEAMTLLWPRLAEAEQQSFNAWRELPSSRRDSDWPGWARYLGPRPARLLSSFPLLRRCV